jgi:hypothetical protein
MKRLVAAAVAASLAVPAHATDSDEQRRRIAAGLLGAGLLGAIIASESNKTERRTRPAGGDVLSTYGYAIAPCVHHARALAGRFELSAVRRIEVRGVSTTVLIDGRTGRGTARASCQVRDGRVVGFGFV